MLAAARRRVDDCTRKLVPVSYEAESEFSLRKLACPLLLKCFWHIPSEKEKGRNPLRDSALVCSFARIYGVTVSVTLPTWMTPLPVEVTSIW